MNRLLGAVFASILIPTLPAVARSKKEIDWRNRSDAVWNTARKEGKPILVEVWATWCPPCRRMDREVWSDPRIIDASRKFVTVSIEIDRDIYARYHDVQFGSHGTYRLHVIPTIFLLDPWQEMILQQEGFIHAYELLKILAEFPAQYDSVRAAREALLEDRDNSRALVQVGELYQNWKGFGIANRYFREALGFSGAKEDLRLRESILFGIAMNEIRRADWRAARRALEGFSSQFPDSPRADQVMLGLVMADVAQKKVASAKERLGAMQARFPNSDAVGTASQLVGGAGKK